jgi:hypothetical protein
MFDNAIAFFYPGESTPKHVPPRQPANSVSGDYSRQYEAIGESNSWDFEVPIPQADLDMAGEDFAVTCSNEEALKLIKDSAVMVGQIIDMLGVCMSLG